MLVGGRGAIGAGAGGGCWRPSDACGARNASALRGATTTGFGEGAARAVCAGVPWVRGLEIASDGDSESTMGRGQGDIWSPLRAAAAVAALSADVSTCAGIWYRWTGGGWAGGGAPIAA